MPISTPMCIFVCVWWFCFNCFNFVLMQMSRMIINVMIKSCYENLLCITNHLGNGVHQSLNHWLVELGYGGFFGLNWGKTWKIKLSGNTPMYNSVTSSRCYIIQVVADNSKRRHRGAWSKTMHNKKPDLRQCFRMGHNENGVENWNTKWMKSERRSQLNV